MNFSELNLAEPILRAVAMEKYTSPSPIQQQAIPHLLAGKDVFGCAQTGTGKTAAFALPILHRLLERRDATPSRAPKALVLTPTRELALQVGASFTAFGRFTGLKTTVVFGGVSQHSQVAALRSGVDVLVATPGRLVDLLRQKLCDLRRVSILVLDEADHMLDLGFIRDVKSIIAAIPEQRQTLLFSATMPDSISSLAASVLRNPVRVAVTPVSSTVESVAQCVYHVNKSDKGRLLVDLLQNGDAWTSLIFSRTKHGADKICKMLNASGIKAGVIHGNKSQAARKEALATFKKGTAPVLVATDIAARGIDIQGLSLVVNYDLPEVPETYVHRIGRTGRAGRCGRAISFCDDSERSSLRSIESLIAVRIPSVQDHALAMPLAAPAARGEVRDSGDRRPVGREKNAAAKAERSKPGQAPVGQSAAAVSLPRNRDRRNEKSGVTGLGVREAAGLEAPRAAVPAKRTGRHRPKRAVAAPTFRKAVG